ncbi:MAG: putative porin, partial [Muribaculaceae bacterium]|nr:putative porin [Muribaculaceae bacterium]
MKRLFRDIALLLTALISCGSAVQAAESKPVTDGSLSYAWRFVPPLGDRVPATIDTLMLNYANVAIPSMAFGNASAITGNYGAEGIGMIYFDRPDPTQFMFDYPLLPYLPDVSRQIFYNTRVPMTLLGYETGGASETAQDRLHATFSGNINKRAQVGAFMDFLYSRGYYDKQSMKDFVWGASGSY